MKLYHTPRGRWSGSRDEIKRFGREDGGWGAVEIEGGKAGLLAFLNQHEVRLGATAPAAQPERSVTPPAKGTRRWRVYVKKLFACVVLADNDDAAREAAIAELEVRAA